MPRERVADNWSDNSDSSLINCDFCKKSFENEPIRMWAGSNQKKIEGDMWDNLLLHKKCRELYKKIKVLVFRQCETGQLEEELKGRKWLLTIFAKVKQDINKEEELESKIEQNKNKIF